MGLMEYHMMVRNKFVKDDVLEAICGFKGQGAYVGVEEKVTCPACLKILSDRCVHTEHCCVLHGCKYSDEDCPVVLRTKRQSYLCEQCDDDHIKDIPDPAHEDYDVLEMHEFRLRDEVRRLRRLLRERGVDVTPPPEEGPKRYEDYEDYDL